MELLQAVEGIRTSQLNLEAMVNNSYQHLRIDQEHNTEEIRAAKESLTHTITTLGEQAQSKMQEEMTKQLDYLRTQITFTLNWTLKHQHAEVLRDINSVLSPIVQSVESIQSKLIACLHNLDIMNTEVMSMKHQSLPPPTPLHFINTAAQTHVPVLLSM